MRRLKSKKAIVILAVAIVFVLVPVALAVGWPFPDVPSSYWAYNDINKVTHTDPPLFNGKSDGKFHPEEPMTRGQMAAVFSRDTTLTANMITEEMTKPNVMRRGCTACHTQIAPDGRYSLAWEAKNALAGHAFAATDNIGLYQTPGATVWCMQCHAGNAQGTAVAALHSMRDIVHPVHMNSGVYVGEFRGNCFNCHNISFNGTYQVLPVAVPAGDDGIPTTLPISSARNPLNPPS